MPKTLLLLSALIFLSSSVLAAEPVLSEAQDESGIAACRCYQSAGWRIWQTDSFRICTLDPSLKLNELPTLCEKLRTKIQESWWSGDANSWRPRCDVIVHATLSDYRRSLGTSVGDSVGCATMQFDGDHIVSRRIDIRVDADNWQHDALPHELTHVVLADRFGTRRLPPWLDEGIGVLAESDRKRQIRAEAFTEALDRGTVYSIHELIHLRQFPSPDYRDAFYVQSGALVRRLIDQAGPDAFVRFASRVLDSGAHAALRESYGISTPAEVSAIMDDSEVVPLITDGGTLHGDSQFVARRDE